MVVAAGQWSVLMTHWLRWLRPLTLLDLWSGLLRGGRGGVFTLRLIGWRCRSGTLFVISLRPPVAIIFVLKLP